MQPFCRASRMTFTNLINSRIERLFHLADTNESFLETHGISFIRFFYDKARVKDAREPVYACKLMKAGRASVPEKGVCYGRYNDYNFFHEFMNQPTFFMINDISSKKCMFFYS